MKLCVCPESLTLGRDLGVTTGQVSSEIEFGRLPYQPMRDIP